jgi:hypothetical protein
MRDQTAALQFYVASIAEMGTFVQYLFPASPVFSGEGAVTPRPGASLGMVQRYADAFGRGAAKVRSRGL